MPRKKARFTHKKKSDKLKRVTPEGHSMVTFNGLPLEYGSFIVENPANHEVLTYKVGDTAYIQWQDLGDDIELIPGKHHWVGKIIGIRANDAADVWVCVEWFWAPEEVAEVIKSFDSQMCGKFEKLSSDNTDIISVHCFVSLVEVKTFDETSIYQESIGLDEWYVRFNFSYDGRRITTKVNQAACNICKVLYTPGQEKILQFCPRPSCMSFYHQACLMKNGYVEKAIQPRLLETWPDIDRSESVEKLCDEYHHSKRRKREHNESGKILADLGPLAELPAGLVAIANQPIVRGIAGGGVVGNINPVCAARNLIFKALTSGGIVPDDWETVVDVPAAHPMVDNFPNTFCPSCHSPI